MRKSRFGEHLFRGLRDARRIIDAWRADYNSAGPHTSLGGLTPKEFATRSGSDQTMNRTN
jgi:putative transposase